MWLMILIAVHTNNPANQPARITLEFDSQQQCERVLSTLTYQVKYSSYKVEGVCQKRS